jgi:hypothetical protein
LPNRVFVFISSSWEVGEKFSLEELIILASIIWSLFSNNFNSSGLENKTSSKLLDLFLKLKIEDLSITD